MDIDLEPHEWRASPRKGEPGEPFFGPGLPNLIAYLTGLVISLTAIYFVFH